MAASATFALNAGVWFRRGRLLMVSPDSAGTACPLSDRNSPYPPVQISWTSSSALFTISLNNAVINSQSFTDLASAEAFFSNNLIGVPLLAGFNSVQIGFSE